MPKPLKKSTELVAEINAMINEMIDSPFDELRLARIRAKIAKIETKFYSEAKALQGMLASIQGKTDEVRQKFNAAIIASGENRRVICLNYARALANVFSFEEASEEIAKIRENYPDDMNALLLALDIHQSVYDAYGAEEVITHLNQLGQQDKIPQGSEKKMLHAKEVMTEAMADWKDVAQRIRLASSVLFSQGFRFSSRVAEIPLESGFLLEFLIFGDTETAIRAENAIHKAIAEQPFSSADKVISFSCLPA